MLLEIHQIIIVNLHANNSYFFLLYLHITHPLMQPSSTMSPLSSSTTTTTNQPPQVHGLSLTSHTQCTHWSSPLDIIAIRHFCCNKFYACISCHKALECHPPTVWPLSQRHERAVLCGQCGHVLSVEEYLRCGSACTRCEVGFNPGCKGHWGMYFELEHGEDGSCVRM